MRSLPIPSFSKWTVVGALCLWTGAAQAAFDHPATLYNHSDKVYILRLQMALSDGHSARFRVSPLAAPAAGTPAPVESIAGSGTFPWQTFEVRLPAHSKVEICSDRGTNGYPQLIIPMTLGEEPKPGGEVPPEAAFRYYFEGVWSHNEAPLWYVESSYSRKVPFAVERVEDSHDAIITANPLLAGGGERKGPAAPPAPAAPHP